MNSNTSQGGAGRRATPPPGGLYRRRRPLGGRTRARNLEDTEAVSSASRAHAFDAAVRLDDLERAFRLARRIRHPDGPILTDLATVGELLERRFPVPEHPPRGVPADGFAILAWPTALNDLVELTEAAVPELFEAVLLELSRVVYGTVRGVPLVVLPEQAELQRFRRVLVPPPNPGQPAAVIIVTDPTSKHGPTAVELLAVLPAGPLVTAFYSPDPPPGEDSDEPES